MTINVTVVVGQWVGDKRVEVLHRTDSGAETRLGVLDANRACQTFVCDGQDIVVREIAKPVENTVAAAQPKAA